MRPRICPLILLLLIAARPFRGETLCDAPLDTLDGFAGHRSTTASNERRRAATNPSNQELERS
jgi:hypothetical protein